MRLFIVRIQIMKLIRFGNINCSFKQRGKKFLPTYPFSMIDKVSIHIVLLLYCVSTTCLVCTSLCVSYKLFLQKPLLFQPGALKPPFFGGGGRIYIHIYIFTHICICICVCVNFCYVAKKQQRDQAFQVCCCRRPDISLVLMFLQVKLPSF